MKRKIGLTATPMPKKWVRVLYIIWKRKLRKIDENLLISLVAMAILLLQVFIIVTAVKAQEKPKGLQIGDKVPDITISNVINYKNPTAKISDFKGKLLILDFWASWCGVCVPSLTKLDALQQQFKDQLMILPVTSQPATTIAPFIAKKGWKLPSVTSDTELAGLFPHRSVPHQVWIKDGVVRSITPHFSATAENIAAMLADKPVDLLTKNDRMDFDPARPLMYKGNGGTARQLNYQSMITGYIDGLGYTSLSRDGIIQVTNNSIEFLYKKSLERRYPWLTHKNRIRLDVGPELRDRISPPLALTGEAEARWFISNGYCYNLVMPGTTTVQKMTDLMYKDLNRFFTASIGIEGSIEKVGTRCLVLKRTGEKDLMKSIGGAPVYEKTTGMLRIANRPFKVFAEALAYEYSRQPMPLLDETGYPGMVNLQLNGRWNDPAVLRKELQKYGLDLREEERDLDMLVIREQKSPLSENP